MKTMTCQQLGGPCDHSHQGVTADEVIKAQDRHLKEMVANGDQKLTVHCLPGFGSAGRHQTFRHRAPRLWSKLRCGSLAATRACPVFLFDISARCFGLSRWSSGGGEVDRSCRKRCLGPLLLDT